MNLANQITPENIIDITIQYKLTDAQVKVAIPSIFVRYYGEIGDANTIRQATILLAEVLPYIKYLQIQAAVLGGGRTVIATQISENLKTVINVGFPVVPPPVTGDINFKVDGVDFVLANALNNVANLSGAEVADRGIDNTPFIAQFQLPKFTDDFFADYTISNDLDDIFIQAIVSGVNWDVLLTGSISVNGSYNIGFATADLIKFVTGGTPSPDNILSVIDSLGVGHLVQTGKNTFYLARDTFYSLKITNDTNGAVNLRQFSNGVEQPLGHIDFSGINDGVSILDATVNEVHVDLALMTVINNVATLLIPKEFFISSEANRNYAEIFANSNTNNFVKLASSVIYYNLSANDNTLGNYFADLLDNLDNILQTNALICNGVQQNIPVTTGLGYAKIRFYFVALGAGVPVQAAGKAASTTGLCTQALITYYTATGTLTTGDTVYTDAALTTPLATFDFILSPDGVIYAINNVTGVVGAASGSTCNVPITGKNLFVVGTATTHFDTDGTDNGAKGAGSNYNIIIRSDSVITNNAGAARTLNFYTSPPFIPANLTVGSGSPAVVANGGTYTLPNTITNYNYVVVT